MILIGLVGYLCFFNGTLFHKILIRHILLNLDSCVKAATLRKRNQRERQRIKRENARIRKQRERELKSKLNKLNELKRRKKSEAQKNQRHKKVAPEKKKQSNIGHY